MEKTTFPETRAVLGEALSAPLDRRRLFDALNALALLDEAHSETTLTELALAWRRTGGRPKTDPGLTLRELFDRFIARYRAEQTATRGRMRWMARTMCRALGPGMPVAALRREDVVGVLETMRSPRSHNGLLSDVAAALRWGNREGLCDLPFVETLRPKPVEFREPAFFPPAKVERILRTAEAHPGPLRAAVGMRLALGFFAGVRSVEAERAAWEDLDLDGAVLRIPRPKGWTNGARPRLVELERNAVAWLRRWKRWTRGQRRGREPRGPVVPRPPLFSEWKKEWLAPAGLSWGGDGDGAANVMRHTYATMHVGAFRDAAATALNLGHGRSTEMLERHYRGLVAKATAEAFWRIFPKDGGA